MPHGNYCREKMENGCWILTIPGFLFFLLVPNLSFESTMETGYNRPPELLMKKAAIFSCFPT